MIAPITNFAALPHEQLIAMLEAGDVSSVRQCGDLWRNITRSLRERADELDQQLAEFSPYWQGSAANEYNLC
jgi:hypothetical protein